MAESVDATVSNTVGATHPGSIPGPGTTAANYVRDYHHFNSRFFFSGCQRGAKVVVKSLLKIYKSLVTLLEFVAIDCIFVLEK